MKFNGVLSASTCLHIGTAVGFSLYFDIQSRQIAKDLIVAIGSYRAQLQVFHNNGNLLVDAFFVTFP
jgi:hypothetical protein